VQVGKTVLITGCSTGIGRALATAFAAQGFDVRATARKIEAIEDLKGAAISVDRLDVTKDEDVTGVVRRMLNEKKRIDVLVNNAGYGALGPLLEIPEEELKRQFETNVLAPMKLVRSVVPSMISNGGGTIINVGSVSGIFVSPFSGAYCASKAALHALSHALRMELAPFHIDVITVQPGGVRSDFGKNADRAVSQVLMPESLYRSIERAVRARARMSQKNAAPTLDVASAIVENLIRAKPKSILRLGRMSFLLPFVERWVPAPHIDRFLMKRFGLTALDTVGGEGKPS
jgi:short-subunit dehydrogenase